MCHKLSQTFGVEDAALQEDFIDFKIVPYLKQQFLVAKDDLVLFWATKVPVHFLALREAAQKFPVLFRSTYVVTRIWILHDESYQTCSLTVYISDKHKTLYMSTFTCVFVPYLTTLARTHLAGENGPYLKVCGTLP